MSVESFVCQTDERSRGDLVGFRAEENLEVQQRIGGLVWRRAEALCALLTARLRISESESRVVEKESYVAPFEES